MSAEAVAVRPHEEDEASVAQQVRVRELVAWGLDENRFRPHIDGLNAKSEAARASVAQLESVAQRDSVARRESFAAHDPLVRDLPEFVARLLEEQSERADLHEEMQGLEWSTGVVDLRELLAFQRRLVFDALHVHERLPAQEDWRGLVALAFGAAIPVSYRTVAVSGAELVLQSENPNLQLRRVQLHGARVASPLPLALHGGSPFFEVAEYRGRWFVRDGYHRAYRLLRAGVVRCPAVIVRARTLAELGPVQPWFFAEETLLGPRPPRVVDFLDDSLTMEYLRPRLYKTLRVRVEESVAPALLAEDSGERS